MNRFARIAFVSVVALILRVSPSGVAAQTSSQDAPKKEVAAEQNPARSRMDELMAQASKMSQLAREGYKLTKEQAASLEEALAQTPDDLNGRARLMGYYFASGSQSLGAEARIQTRRRHILWLIRNHPDSALLMTSEATIDPRGHSLADPEGYEQAGKAWLEQTAKNDASTALLGNAGRFFFLPGKAHAAEFYARARKLEPENAMWVMMQGRVMAFAIVGIMGMNQNGFPGPADPAEAGSDFAKSIRRELETTKDTALMKAAAGELMGRGFMAQSMARSMTGARPPVDALELAESLLKRAHELDPGKPESNVALAKIYELRGMSATSEAEKKALARARYEQLVKAASGLPTDDPASSDQLLTLARASLDAGELDRAQTLAKSLLALVPRLQADPRFSSSVDGILHHSHLILGRVALRKGDIEAAKANLLDAGRVGGSATLSSFGPNMTLAKELLENGEKETVLQYLELCRKFWTFSNRLDPWIEAIRKGQIPDFGANLYY
jgi:tetratricopeptide (TPR) repeat protein